MMDTTWLEKARELRQQAYDALLSSPPYLAFKAFDDAVVNLGGTPLLETTEASGSAFRDAAKRVMEATTKRVADGRRLSQGEAAELVLRQQKEPLPIGRLMPLVLEKGVEIGGSDPLNNFRSTVSKDPRFRSVRRNNMHFWWLTAEPLPPSWNEPEPDDLEHLIGSGPSVSSDQEGGDGHAPATT